MYYLYLYIYAEGRTIGGLENTFPTYDDAKNAIACIPTGVFFNLIHKGNIILTNDK